MWVQETETQLAEEVAGVCRDYCAETWAKTLNRAGVPANSELRRAESIFFPVDIREVLATPRPLVADPLLLLVQFPTIQAPFPNAKVPIGVGKGKEVQPSIKAKHSEDAFMDKDVVSKAKDAESKSKATNPKKDPHQAKA